MSTPFSAEEPEFQKPNVKSSSGRSSFWRKNEDALDIPMDGSSTGSSQSQIPPSQFTAALKNAQATPAEIVGSVQAIIAEAGSSKGLSKLQELAAVNGIKADTTFAPNNEIAMIHILSERLIKKYSEDMLAGGERAANALRGLQVLVNEMNDNDRKRLGDWSDFEKFGTDVDEIREKYREVDRLVLEKKMPLLEAFEQAFDEKVEEGTLLHDYLQGKAATAGAVLPTGQPIPLRAIASMKAGWEARGRQPVEFRFSAQGTALAKNDPKQAVFAGLGAEQVRNMAMMSAETEVINNNGSPQSVLMYKYPSPHVEGWFKALDEGLHEHVQERIARASRKEILGGHASAAFDAAPETVHDLVVIPEHPAMAKLHASMEKAASAVITDPMNAGNFVVDAANNVGGFVMGRVSDVPIPGGITTLGNATGKKKEKSQMQMPQAMALANFGMQVPSERSANGKVVKPGSGPFVRGAYDDELKERLPAGKAVHIAANVKKAAKDYFDTLGMGKDLTASTDKFQIMAFYSNPEFREFAFVPDVSVGAESLQARTAAAPAKSAARFNPWSAGAGIDSPLHAEGHGHGKNYKKKHHMAYKSKHGHGHGHGHGHRDGLTLHIGEEMPQGPQMQFDMGRVPDAEAFSFGHMAILTKPMTLNNIATGEKQSYPKGTRFFFGNKLLFHTGEKAEGKFDHLQYKTYLPASSLSKVNTSGEVFRVKELVRQKPGYMFHAESLAGTDPTRKTERGAASLIIYDQ